MPAPHDISALEAAAEALRVSCLHDPQHPDAAARRTLIAACASPDDALAVPAARLLIGRVVEDLSDRFDPALVECYVDLFTEALAACQPVWSAQFLRTRYQQLRTGSPPPAALPVSQVYVLSRITLGADIAVTSVFLDAVSKRYPQAVIWFVGPAKNFDLFAGSPRVRHWPLDYPRGATLPQRIALAEQLTGLSDEPGTLLVDPDSRISQLGLLPLAPSTRTLFFESRTADSDTQRTLSEIASSFCFLRLAVPDAAPFLALPQPLLHSARDQRQQAPHAPISISLGVGGNPAKRASAPFEADLLRVLAATGRPLWIDAGAGGAEADCVRNAVTAAALPAQQVTILDGSFARFCAHIAESALYVGYDSAGQHAASALGIPGITVFRGFVNSRMLARWTPRGPHSRVLPLTPEMPETSVLQALQQHLETVGI